MLSETKCDMMFKDDSCFVMNSYNSSNDRNIKISNNKICMVKFCNAIKELKILKETAQYKTLSLDIWNDRVSNCERIKSQIEHAAEKLKNNFDNSLKIKLQKRYHLRKSIKKNRKKWILFKNMSNIQKRQLVIYIDATIKDKKNDLIWEKQKDMLRKDADIVLLDVQTKRTDVRKFLTMLQEIENLRKIKVDVLKLRDNSIFIQADQTFNNIIQTLKQQWTVLDKEYILEEKGLKLMIKNDNKHKILTYSKKNLSNWESILFNQIMYSNNWSDCNLQIYLENRSMWDQYLEEVEGTKVSIGWIIPYGPSSAAWTQYQINQG